MDTSTHSTVPPSPRVPAETAREHVVNGLTTLETYRTVNGGDWYKALHGPVQVNELAALLESVEARLRLALAK